MIRLLLPVIIMLGAAPAVGRDDPPRIVPETHGVRLQQDWRARMIEVERLIRAGSHGRATTLLEQLEKTGAPRTTTLPSWVALARAMGDTERVVELCEEGLATRPGSRRLLTTWAEALAALDRRAEAREAVRRNVEAAPNKVSAVAESVAMWRRNDRPEEGLALCDSLRAAQGVDDLLRRHRAACLLELDRIVEAMDEIAAELAGNPLNLRLVRLDIAPLLPDSDARTRAAGALADRPDAATPAVALLRADLLLLDGRARDASAAVAHLRTDPVGALDLLRTAAVLAREAPMIDDPAARRATVAWLLTELDALAMSPAVAAGQRARVLDMLAGAAVEALGSGLVDDDPEGSVERLEEVLDRVRAGSPGSSRLYSARILLARHTRDVLGDPGRAADSLARLLTDLDLPLQGVALCRLELGVCRLAEKDTARARTVLTRLGRSTQYPEAAGPAHALLARLDLAQGHWESARDRLAAVALDDPRADQANDALDLALLLAEELSRQGGGEALLAAYAPSVLADLCRDDDARRDALRIFLETATADPAAPLESELVARARLELGELEAAAGRPAAAADLASAVVRDRPEGGHAAEALLARGRWLSAAGDAAGARDAWERLAIQYPESLSAEDARNLLRELP